MELKEQIIKQMQEWCDNMCENACLKGERLNGKTFTCEICFPNTVRNALALINSQEQRIKELTEEYERLRAVAPECVDKVYRFMLRYVDKLSEIDEIDIIIRLGQIAKEMLEGE